MVKRRVSGGGKKGLKKKGRQGQKARTDSKALALHVLLSLCHHSSLNLWYHIAIHVPPEQCQVIPELRAGIVSEPL